MKVAATFLLSVIVFTSVFLESSTTPVNSSSNQTLDSVQIPAAIEYINKTFQNSNALLADNIAFVEKALNKVTDDDTKTSTLTPVDNWLRYLQSYSAEAESTILELLEKGTLEAVEDAFELFGKAINDTGAQLDKYVELLENSRGEVMDSVKTVFKDSLNAIFVRARTGIMNAIKALLLSTNVA